MKYKKMIFLPVIIGISLSIVLYLSQSSQDHSEEIDVNSLKNCNIEKIHTIFFKFYF